MIKLVTKQSKITTSELKEFANQMFGNLVKAVIDVDNELMAVQAELHSDLEAYLLQNISVQKNLWGINLYPELDKDDFIEFDSMINLRPSQGNNSRGVDDIKIQEKIKGIITQLVQYE